MDAREHERHDGDPSDHETESSDSLRASDASRGISLSAADFHRLGVRPAEARLTVIRQAAAKTTKTLAQRQLTTPSAKTELQLSRVATSAYRLLDPRQRDNPSERTHVGRILPNALRWAGQTQFQTGHPVEPSASEPLLVGAPQELPFTEFESELDEPATMQISGLSLSGDPGDWPHGLSDSPRRRSSGHGWLRRQVNRPLVLVTLIVVLSGAAAGLWKWKGNFVSPLANQPSPAAPTVTVKQASSRPPAEDRPEPPPAVVNPFKQVAAHDEQPWLRTDESSQQPVVSDYWPVIVEVDDQMLPLLPTNADPSLQWLWQQLIAHTDSSLLSWSEGIGIDASRQERDAGLPSPDAAEPQQRVPVPSDDQIAQARRQLIGLVPELGEPLAVDTVTPLLKQLVGVLDKVNPGSVDEWVVRVAMAEVDWLIRDLDYLQVRLTPLVDRFDADLNQLLAATFSNMATPIETVELHEHLMDNGILLTERLISAQSWMDCRRVLQTTRDSANFLGDAARFTILDEYDEALVSMQRLHDTAADVDDGNVETATPSKAGITGRYQCLMLRCWSVGLPWLAKGSDPRLSKLAADELSLGADPPPKERVAIATRWLSAAKRSRGREADSMRLHALEQLKIAAQAGRGLQQLEAESLIAETMESLSPYLHAIIEKAERQNVAPAPQIASIEKPGARGLSGRIRTSSGDIGVQLDYETSMEITAAVFDQIAAKSGQTIPGWTIELVGQFETKKSSALQLRVGESTADMTQEVWLGKTMITFPPDQTSAVVPVLAGTHTIRWRVDAARIKSIFLAVHDAETHKRINIKPAYQPRGDELPTKLTIKIVRSTR